MSKHETHDETPITAISVPSYNTQKSVYVGSDLFKVRYNLSAIAQKVLFTLAQRLKPSTELFPLWSIDIRTLFECCGLDDNNNKRYAIIRNAIKEIGTNPLERPDSTDESWETVYWFDKCSFDKKSMHVTIMFGYSIKEYLLQFNKFVEIKPVYFRHLGNYAMYLYPMLKNELYLSKKFSKYDIIVDKEIEYLKRFMFCDKIKSYADNTLFLQNVIGIQRKQSTDGNKDDIWEYSTKKAANKIHYISPIKEISDHTDIVVLAQAVKQGKAYYAVRFTISLKSTAVDERLTKHEENAQKALEAKAEVKSGKKRPDVEVVDKRHQSTMLKEANEAGLSVEKYAKLAGYVKRGEWYLLFAKKTEKSISQI